MVSQLNNFRLKYDFEFLYLYDENIVEAGYMVLPAFQPRTARFTPLHHDQPNQKYQQQGRLTKQFGVDIYQSIEMYSDLPE